MFLSRNQFGHPIGRIKDDRIASAEDKEKQIEDSKVRVRSDMIPEAVCITRGTLYIILNEMNDVDIKTCTVDSAPQELEAKMREKSDQPQAHSK